MYALVFSAYFHVQLQITFSQKNRYFKTYIQNNITSTVNLRKYNHVSLETAISVRPLPKLKDIAVFIHMPEADASVKLF